MKTKILRILLVVLFIMQLALSGMANTIDGWIYDQNQKTAPLIGVNIFWAGTTLGTTSNTQGYFKLPTVENNNRLVVSYVGYKTDTIYVDDQNTLTIYLTSGANLNEVTVVERVNATNISKINPILTQNITSKELTKFACCNLSESFETNASVDVAYADAVSGIKQIKMLGLSGKYSQLMLENTPILRGGETAFGLDYIPGTWMDNIQVSKGTSAVKNGYESITGQINITYKSPDTNEKLHLYAYGNQDGKVETNAGYSFKVNNNWSSSILVHGSTNARKLDMNHDGFLDKPLSITGNVLNRWNYFGNRMELRMGVSYLNEMRDGGQVDFDHSKPQQNQSYYGIGIDVWRLNGFAKMGILLNRPNTNIGIITNVNHFNRQSFYGNHSLDVTQTNFYGNVMFQSYMGNTHHTYTTGISAVYDNNNELFDQNQTGFVETVPGIFIEYNYIPHERLSLLVGLRNDYSSLHGNFVTPRIHFKYNFPAYSTLRLSAGKGYRTALTISENTQYLASSRSFFIDNNPVQEEAWNYGASLTNEIPLGKRDVTLTLEYFRTDFKNQLVVDLYQNENEVHFYHLEGTSYANSFQVEAFYELFKQFELTAGFRANDVRSTYNGILKTTPFVNNYKGLISGQYRTNLDKWQFDMTVQFHGVQHLPYSSVANPSVTDPVSDNYITLIAQITKNYRYWSFYVGAENLTNYTQEHAIIDPENPFGTQFDASQIWGPLYGRMFYVGVRYVLDKRF